MNSLISWYKGMPIFVSSTLLGEMYSNDIGVLNEVFRVVIVNTSEIKKDKSPMHYHQKKT